MKIKVRHQFTYYTAADNATVHTLLPGEYEVPRQASREAADLAISFGHAVVVHEPRVEKVAPENKLVEAPENKAKRDKKAK